jgi:uncharacterized membrane protein YeaQ/YmgE (transglycosylase-associated protein family)
MQARAIAVSAAVGAVAGLLFWIVMPFAKWGLLGTLLVGTVGAVVGSWTLSAAGVRIKIGDPLRDTAATAAAGGAGVLILARLLA